MYWYRHLTFALIATSLILSPSDAISSPKTLGAGDLIYISVSSQKHLSRRHKIDRKGSIFISLFGKIRLAGLSLSQAERRLRSTFSRQYKKLGNIYIRVIKYQKYISLQGWVKKPGTYVLKWQDSLNALLTQSGGAKPGARLEQIWLHTKGQKPRSFNLLHYYSSNGKAKQPILQRNTVVFIPMSPSHSPKSGKSNLIHPSSSRIAILGAVKKPGIYPCFWSVDLLQALAMADGTLEKSGIQEVLISPGNRKVRWFDLKGYWLGHNKKLPLLRPGTILFVPYKPHGLSRRGPIRIIGEVGKPGIVRGKTFRDLPSLLASRGGPRGNADLHNVTVVYHGKNFTISQKVDVRSALAEGRLDRLAPIHPGPMVVFVPPKKTANVTLTDMQNVVQLVVATASIITTVILITSVVQGSKQSP